jgi:flagellar biosynthetic protein FliR
MDLAFVTRLGLLLIRPGLLVSTAPPFGAQYTPTPVKLGLSIVLGVVMAPLVAMPTSVTLAVLTVLVAREAVIGLALGMSVRILMAGAEVAGQLAGFQLGFAYAATVDPQTGARNNVVASLYSSLTLLTYLLLNGHHALLRALAESYRVMPIGLGHVEAGVLRATMAMMGVVFAFGVQVAAPIVVVLLIAELALGLVSRAAPALHLIVVGAPLRLMAGLVALAAAIGVLPNAVARLVTPTLELAGRLALAFR